jgi:hypothetical protein
MEKKKSSKAKRSPKKERSPLTIVLYIVLLALLAWSLLIFADNINDRQDCTNEFKDMIGASNAGYWQFDSAFANDDYFRINLGGNIHCMVFWRGWKGYPQGNGYLALVEFTSGSLTTAKIEGSRYW